MERGCTKSQAIDKINFANSQVPQIYGTSPNILLKDGGSVDDLKLAFHALFDQLDQKTDPELSEIITDLEQKVAKKSSDN